MGTANYASEKCYVAVRTLAAGSGDLRERPSDVWISSLMLLKAHSIPWQDIREKFDAISARLSDSPETIAGMSLGGLRKVAQDVVDLYDGVCRRYSEDPEATSTD